MNSSNPAGYLKELPSKARKKIRSIYREQGGKGKISKYKMRSYMQKAIFDVMDYYECQNNGVPDNELVVKLRKAKNKVEEDMGWND